MNTSNPNIVALQAAERQLRDHDRKIAEAAAELKGLKAERVDISARVQACIDVLCGRSTPGLFDAIGEDGGEDGEREEGKGGDVLVISQCPKCLVFNKTGRCETCDATPPAGPVVCAPVGSCRLVDIQGVTQDDAKKMEAKGIRTLADLEKLCSGDASNTHIYRVLVLPKGPLPGPDADRVANAITAHLRPATVPAEPKGPRITAEPPDDEWRDKPFKDLTLKPVWSALARHEVATVGELFDWMQEDAASDGGIFGPGALRRHLLALLGNPAGPHLHVRVAEKAKKKILTFLAEAGFRHTPNP